VRREFEFVVDELMLLELGARPKIAKVVSTMAWPTAHGYAKPALQARTA
jgi:hypothetical protein